MFKKIIATILNKTEEGTKKIEAPSIIVPGKVRPYAPQDNEEITKLLTNFDNAALMAHITTLEKVVANLCAKVEIQSGVIARQSEILKEFHTTIEELIQVIDVATSNSKQSRSVSPINREETLSVHNKKNGLN